MVELLQIFKDVKVKVVGSSQFGRYKALYELVPVKERRPLTLRDLKAHVNRLKRKYPYRHFQLRHTCVGGREFWVIDRKSRYRDENGNVVRVWDRVPIYIDLKTQSFYVPKWYVKNKRKLAYYIIMVTLCSLGVARTKYVNNIGRS